MKRQFVAVSLFVVLAGCGKAPDAISSGACKAEQDKLLAEWKSQPDKIDGNKWIYIDEGVGQFTYSFSIDAATGACHVTLGGAGSDPSDFNPFSG